MFSLIAEVNIVLLLATSTKVYLSKQPRQVKLSITGELFFSHFADRCCERSHLWFEIDSHQYSILGLIGWDAVLHAFKLLQHGDI